MTVNWFLTSCPGNRSQGSDTFGDISFYYTSTTPECIHIMTHKYRASTNTIEFALFYHQRLGLSNLAADQLFPHPLTAP